MRSSSEAGRLVRLRINGRIDFAFCAPIRVIWSLGLYRTIFPCEYTLSKFGPRGESLAGIPIVIVSPGQVEQTVTDFLIERVTGSWCGVSGGRLSRNSIKTLANDLTNFLSYCSLLNLNWMAFERGDETKVGSLIGYANAMDNGNWSRHRMPISSRTIARRLRAAQDLLCYAASREKRTIYKPMPIKGYGARAWTDKRPIVLPMDQEITLWYGRLLKNECRRNYLMARMAFETGMRKEEIIRFPASAVPNMEEIQASDFVYLHLEYGTKGGRSRYDASLRGKPRVTRVNSSFALQLYTFKTGASQRQSDLLIARSRHGQKFQVQELFFNPHTGKCFSRGHLNSLFKRERSLDAKPWHPHVGRHYYACKLLVDLILSSTSRSELERAMSYEKFGALADRAIAVVQGFLGHESRGTTERYLRWAYARLVAEGVVH